jgi:hypothetical protein
MKLYLSSFRVPDSEALAALLGKPLLGAKLALIPNAKDYYAPRARAVKTREMSDYLADIGFEVTEDPYIKSTRPSILKMIGLLDLSGN